MEIEIEIHRPGLDMEQSRWTHHFIFMEEVHGKQTEISGRAWDYYQSRGRGTLFVDREQWLKVVRDSIMAEAMPFPCSYLAVDDAAERVDFGVVGTGFRRLMEEYDPKTHLVLTVEHHPQGLQSCYVIKPGRGPEEAHGGAQRA